MDEFVKHAAVKLFVTKTTSFKRTLDKIEREKKLTAAAGATHESRTSTPPLVAIAVSILESKGAMNVTASAFEAKNGHRGANVGPAADTDPSDVIGRHAKTKKAFKDLNLHLRNHSSGLVDISDQPTLNKFQKEIKKSFDATVVTVLVLPPDQDWTKKVFSMQYLGQAANFVSIGFHKMCLTECRLLIEGEELIMGLPLQAIPGPSLLEKRRWVFMQTVDALAQVVSEHGWMWKHDSTTLAIVPSGFVVVIVSQKGCKGVRWSVGADEADTLRVKMQLQDMIASFPESGNPSTGYQLILSWLNTL